MTNTLDENLRYSFDLVNEWLRFAEAKIATALALNGVGIAVITTLIVSESFNTYYELQSSWCNIHGAEYCKGIVALDR